MLWFIHTVEYFAAFKNNDEGALPLLTWKNLLRHSQWGRGGNVLRNKCIISPLLQKTKSTLYLICTSRILTYICKCIEKGLEKFSPKSQGKRPCM